MGHVINPISLRVGYTLSPSVLWHTHISHNYSYVTHISFFITSYIKKLFAHPYLRHSWLLNSIKIVFNGLRFCVFISLYSQKLFFPFSSFNENYTRHYKCNDHFNLIRWLFFLLIRNFYLSQIFFFLKNLIIKDFLSVHSIKICPFFVFTPQQLLSSQSWVYFIKYKLKKNASFSSIMFKVMPVLNQLLYNKKTLLGYKITCAGRTSRRGRASFSFRSKGKLPLSSVTSFVSYSFGTVVLKNSLCGIKVWLFFKKRPLIFNSQHVFIV